MMSFLGETSVGHFLSHVCRSAFQDIQNPFYPRLEGESIDDNDDLKAFVSTMYRVDLRGQEIEFRYDENSNVVARSKGSVMLGTAQIVFGNKEVDVNIKKFAGVREAGRVIEEHDLMLKIFTVFSSALYFLTFTTLAKTFAATALSLVVVRSIQEIMADQYAYSRVPDAIVAAASKTSKKMRT